MKQETQNLLEVVFMFLERDMVHVTNHPDNPYFVRSYIKEVERFINILDNDQEAKVEMMDEYLAAKKQVSAYYEACKQSESGKAVIDL